MNVLRGFLLKRRRGRRVIGLLAPKPRRPAVGQHDGAAFDCRTGAPTFLKQTFPLVVLHETGTDSRTTRNQFQGCARIAEMRQIGIRECVSNRKTNTLRFPGCSSLCLRPPRPGAHNALTLIDMTEHSRAVDKFVQLCEPAAQFGISCALEFAAWLGVSSIPAAQCNRERSRPSQRRRLFIHIDCPARRTEDVRQN
jgi:hypothetical protein